MLNNVNTVFW